MAKLTRPESKKLYSWWWDGHTAPKNSKWLRENLEDMDVTVKAMIKLLEEDADSFARRAEMYYKRRPELLKLLEEFYRAYRAIAERYDHATGALRQAHRTMAEAFPNQVPFLLSDDLDESDALLSKKGLKQFKDIFGSGEMAKHLKSAEGKVRKDLSLQEDQEHGPEYKTLQQEISQLLNEEQNLKSQVTAESVRAEKSEAEVHTLKDTIYKSCSEKEAAVLQNQLFLEKISALEAEISRSNEELKKLNDEMLMAEAKMNTGEERRLLLEKANESLQLEFVNLKQKAQEQQEELRKKQEELEKLNLLLQEERQAFNQTEATRLSLEKLLSQSQDQERLLALEIHTGTEKLKDIELRRVTLEEELLKIKEDNGSLNEQNINSASQITNLQDEVRILTEAISVLNSEKETVALQYQISIERISALESEISHSKEEWKKLKDGMLMAEEKLNTSEHRCLLLENTNESLQKDLDRLKLKADEQQEELSKKQDELDKLNLLLQEKHQGFMFVETARLSLEQRLSQSQEHERLLNIEIQSATEKLKDTNFLRIALEEELEHIKLENSNLNEQCLLSASKITSLQDEISLFKISNINLENELNLLRNEKKALLEEFSCIKEDRNDLEKSYRRLTEQVEAANFNVMSLQALVKQLQNANAELKERCNKHEAEKVIHTDNLTNLGKVSEKNVVLENSLLDANVEIESLREKIKGLEQSCELLCDEISVHLTDKTTLDFQLKAFSQDMEQISDRNVSLKNSLSEVSLELEDLRAKLKVTEESCQSLCAQNSALLSEKSSLVSQIEETSQTLQDLEARFMELEDNYFNLESEKDSTLQQAEEMDDILKREKEEYETLILSIMRSSNSQQSMLENQIYLLEEEARLREEELEVEHVQSVAADIQIVVLQGTLYEMNEHNSILTLESQKLLQTSMFADTLLSELKKELSIKEEILTSSEKCNEMLSNGIRLIQRELNISQDSGFLDGIRDEVALQPTLCEIENLRKSLSDAQDENLHLLLEKSVITNILEQFGVNILDLEKDKCALRQECKAKTNELSLLQSKNLEFLEINNQLRQDMQVNNHKQSMLMSDTELFEANQMHIELQKNVSSLSEAVERKHEISSQDQTNEMLTCKLIKLQQDVENLRTREEHLTINLQKEVNEGKCCEVEITELLKDLQVATVEAVLFEEKVSELFSACESLEISSKTERERLHEEINTINANVAELNEKFGIMEGENKDMKEERNSYLVLVEDLSDDISSLEEGILSLAERYLSNHQAKQGSELVFHHHRKSSQETSEYHSASGPAAIVELQKLNAKIKALKKMVTGTGNLLKQEVFELSNVRSESALKEVRLLKAKEELEKNGKPGTDLYLQKGDSLKHEQVMKDIQLDLVLSSSQFGNDVRSCGGSTVDIAGSSTRSNDSWETTESLPINPESGIEYRHLEAVDEKSKYPSPERVFEKELSIDKMELPKIFTELHEEWNGRIINTLSSDSHRLSVLQTSARELKRSMEASDISKYPTTFEFNTIKSQLKEAEGSISQLIDINKKLTRKSEELAASLTGLEKPNETRNKHRRQISEFAKRSSNKIGMLELELQKIHYIFLKLGEEHENKKPKGVDRRRIQLRDYLYGKMDSRRRKKNHCGCIRSRTVED